MAIFFYCSHLIKTQGRGLAGPTLKMESSITFSGLKTLSSIQHIVRMKMNTGSLTAFIVFHNIIIACVCS